MSEPFLAEIRMVGFNFAPRGWGFCDGQLLPITQNQSLYSLLGTTYGGDGRTTFALPDLRGRTPIHVGKSNGGIDHRLGGKGGEETRSLSAQEMAGHTHSLKASSVQVPTTGTTPNATNSVANSVLSQSPTPEYWRDAEAANAVDMGGATVANSGGGQAHNNMQPCLAVYFCIALRGLFPSRN